jgi:hypothetical protein
LNLSSGFAGLGSHPLVQTVLSFLAPAMPLRIGPRWVVYAGLLTLGIWIWRRCRSPRHLAIRLLAGTMLISVFSAMTGIFELPAWEGRNVFISLYAGLALALWTGIHRFPGLVRKAFHSSWLLALGIAAVAGPALVWPPMIGRNVPIAAVVRPRAIPADNLVLRELNRPVEIPAQRKTLALIPSWNPPSDLIINLMRMHKNTRANLFPAYRLVAYPNMASAKDCDALLVAEALFTESPWSRDFIPHARGAHFIFALRKPPENP